MTLLTADRGQALQVGAVLLFGILVILFTVWQAFVIPDQNERVEFSHSQEVQSEMVELRGNIVSTADATTPTSGSVKLGEQFPTRLLFINPSPAAGTLQTESLGDEEFIIQNANSTAAETGTRLFWNGTNRTYDTTSFRYSPDYRVFQGAPETFYDNTVTYNFFERDQNSSALSEQAVIDGNTITLISLVGEYSESGIGSVTPDLTPLSTQSRSIPIQNNGSGENITLYLPTRLNASQWRQLLEEELYDPTSNPGGAVDEVRSSSVNETVEIELREGRYELRMAQVGVGEGLTESPPAYLRAIEGARESISQSQNHTITVEVRDKFNVPQSNVRVIGSVDSSKGNLSGERTTNVDGQATFELEPDSSNLTANETVQLEFESPSVAIADDGVDTITVNVTTEDTGPEVEIRWTDVPAQGRCTSESSPSVGTYYTDCSYNNINQFNGTYTLTAVADNATGVEAQFTNTNDSLADIIDPNNPGRKLRGEFSNNGGSFEVTIELEGRSGLSSVVETTLMAFAGDDTEALFIEVDES